MSDFEFIFALFGLLLGLSLAEVLGGFARAIDVRTRPGSKVRIGWLTPLLGGFVLLDLLSFWSAAWLARSAVFVSHHALLSVTVFASAYYFAAHLVFPRSIEEQPDLDDHYRRVHRIVIGTMLALLVGQIGWYATVPVLAARFADPVALVLTAVLVVLMMTAMLVRGERASRWVMVALVARYLVVYLR